MATTETVDLGDGVRLQVRIYGPDPRLVLLPSANRGAEDFDHLGGLLAEAGHASVAVNPRGIAGSTGPLDALTMRDLADDVAGVAERLAGGPVHVVGHALGNTVARATATYRPGEVRSLCLLACGGHDLERHQPSPPVMAAFGRCFDLSLNESERVAALQTTFFAAGNDPRPWLDGWWPEGRHIGEAMRRSDWREWWRGGDAPVLIVQPVEDMMGPLAVGRELALALDRRARYVEIPHCGHAILPEQPEVVAETLVAFLRDLS
jgi:pimeloyl-ACP methyl ester carboxylesterase